MRRENVARLRVDVHLNELAETRRIVITCGLGVTKGLQQRVRVKHVCLDTLDRAHICLSRTTRCVQGLLGVSREDALVGPCNVGKDNLARLGLSGSRLTRDNDRLVLLVNDELLEAVFGNHEEMRAGVLGRNPTRIGRLQATDLSAVVSDFLRRSHVEDRECLVRIDTEQNRCTDLGEDFPVFLEAFLDIV